MDKLPEIIERGLSWDHYAADIRAQGRDPVYEDYIRWRDRQREMARRALELMQRMEHP